MRVVVAQSVARCDGASISDLGFGARALRLRSPAHMASAAEQQRKLRADAAERRWKDLPFSLLASFSSFPPAVPAGGPPAETAGRAEEEESSKGNLRSQACRCPRRPSPRRPCRAPPQRRWRRAGSTSTSRPRTTTRPLRIFPFPFPFRSSSPPFCPQSLLEVLRPSDGDCGQDRGEGRGKGNLRRGTCRRRW